PSKKSNLYYQLRYADVDKNQSENSTKFDFVVPTKKYSSMLNFEYQFGNFSFRNRVVWSYYQQSNGKTKGMAIVQDLSTVIRKLKVSFRYALFDTDDYDNRQYVYERDVLYTFSFPAYEGKGIRTYLLLQSKIRKNIDVWFRISNTKYMDRDLIGTGLE